jgi:hypothetical protein
MSQQTYLYIFSERRRQGPLATLDYLIDITGTWRFFPKFCQMPQKDTIAVLQYLMQLTGGDQFRVGFVEGGQYTSGDRPIPGSDVFNLWKPNRVLSISPGRCDLETKIYQQVESSVDPNIRGKNFLANPCIKFGKHKLRRWNDAEEKWEKTRYPYVLLSFWGYETPNNWAAYETAVLELPIVKQLIADMGTLFPKVEACFDYDY